MYVFISPRADPNAPMQLRYSTADTNVADTATLTPLATWGQALTAALRQAGAGGEPQDAVGRQLLTA